MRAVEELHGCHSDVKTTIIYIYVLRVTGSKQLNAEGLADLRQVITGSVVRTESRTPHLMRSSLIIIVDSHTTWTQ